MNGVDGSSLMTIHVTPEAGFSYASCEMHRFLPSSMAVSDTVAAIVSIFQPRHFVVACTFADRSVSDIEALKAGVVRRFEAADANGHVMQCNRTAVATLTDSSEVAYLAFERGSGTAAME
jgi:Adenosylmethionine decarboxylase